MSKTPSAARIADTIRLATEHRLRCVKPPSDFTATDREATFTIYPFDGSTYEVKVTRLPRSEAPGHE